MKTHDHDNAHAAQRRVVAQQAEHGEAATQLAQAGADTFDHHVNHSPRMMAQRQLLGAAFGSALQQPVQRGAGLDDEEPAVQAKQEVPVEANLTGMPSQLKSGVEALSGMDMSDVRVHRNSDKPAQLNALAYAQGNEIHLGPGQERHISHEAWHVVQQRQGRVAQTKQMAGLGVNEDLALERDADGMGARALAKGAAMAFAHERPAQLRAAASPIGRSVAQLATNLRFDNNVTGASQITATQHNRTGVNLTAQQWVLQNGAWNTVPAGTVCNHSSDYDAMAQQILDAIHDEDLSDAAGTLQVAYATLQANNMGMGAAMATHSNRINNVIATPGNVVNVDDMIDSFNYYIYKICDYPRNLFFWPQRTGANPDEPYGPAAPSAMWVPNNPLISRPTRLAREKARLTAGRTNLNAALP